MLSYRRFSVFLFVVILICCNARVYGQSDGNSDQDELARINRELDNPLAKRWSLVFQENFTINQGDLMEGSVISNTVFFQPARPIPFGRNKVFTARPVFPLVTQPYFSEDASGIKKVSGVGDIQMAALFGPGNARGWNIRIQIAPVM